MKKYTRRMIAMLAALTVLFSLMTNVCCAYDAEDEIATAAIEFEYAEEDEKPGRRN